MRVSRAWVGVGAAALVMGAAAATLTVTLESDATPADPPRERDDDLFISQVNDFLDGGYRGPRSQQNPPTVLIAEGERACAWLASQPIPEGRDTEKAPFPSFKRYLREVAPLPDWPFGIGSAGVRGEVVYDAWLYLCDDVRVSHIWQSPPGEYD